MARYTPSLSQLIDLSFFPDELSFIKDGISLHLSNLYYKDLRSSDSSGTNRTISNITIITNSPVDFELGEGSGFKIILNPSSQSTQTEIDITYGFQWGILNFFRDFDFKSFDFSNPQAYLDLLIKTSGIDESDLLEYFVRGQYEIPGIEDPIYEFIQYFNNSSYSPTTPLNEPNLPSNEEIYDDLVAQLSSNGNSFQVSDIVFQELLLGLSSASEIEEKLFLVFKYVHDDFAQYLRNLIAPQFFGILNDIEIAISFPRSLLIPLDSNGKPLPGANDFSTISWTADRVSFSSKQGFNISSDSSLALSPSQIGKTGLTIDATNIKVDFNEQLNIAEADNDGRPVAFKGVFIGSVNIGFPENWVKSASSTATISGTNLLIGSPGGISGTIDIDTAGLLKFDLLGLSVEFFTFQMEFKQNSVVSTDVTGTLIIPGLKDGGGNDAELDFNIDWSMDGYEICVSEPQGLKLEIENVIEFTFKKLCIGQIDGKWQFKVQGRIDRIKDIPMVGKAIPRYLDVKHFNFFEGQDNDFDLEFGWDGAPTVNLTDDGITGNTSFEKVIPVNKTFLGALEVELVKFVLTAANNQLQIDSTINANLEIGPLYGAVEGAGFRTIIDFPNGGGNLGPADLSFELVEPTGMALSMGAAGGSKSGFSVSGYLAYDKSKKTYKGALDVTFAKIVLSAYGILALELPGGKKGFSLIVVISVEFTPAIQVGFGFALKGVGGLLGLHRTMETQVLRLGVKDDSLDNILFPAPPIAEKAPQILSVIDSAFPIKEHQFVFGPIAMITWGTNSLMSLELGLIVEVDNPFRIVILGVFKALMPAEGKELLKLQVNFLGEINFTQKYITFDASLYDSRLLSLTLMGDMLLRVFWGDNGGFLVSVGGFHPLYNRPANMMLPAKITRLTISLVNKPNLKIGVEAYFAVSSNTVQFGIKGHLYVKAWKFTVEGYLGFDVLIYFRPKFRFIAGIYASFSVKYKKWNLLGISIDFTLEGPGPFHAFGKGKVKILGIGKTVKFDETFGQEKTTMLPSVDVGLALKEAFEDYHSWESILPERNALSVTLRKMTGLEEQVVVHPLGSLKITQKIVPLKLTIQQFGNANPISATYFDLLSVKIAGNAFPLKEVKEQFAPAQFFKYSESDLLKEASFKDYRSGVQLDLESSGTYLESDKVLSIEVTAKEEIIIDQEEVLYDLVAAAASPELLAASFSEGSAIGHFKGSGRINANTNFDGTSLIDVVEETFVPVDKNGVPQSGLAFESYEAGEQWLNNQLASNALLEEDSYQIVSMDDFNSFSGN